MNDWLTRESNAEFFSRMRLGFGTIDPRSHFKLSGITDPPAPSRDTLWTRHMVGVRELERDRRRHGRVYAMTFTNSDRVLIGNVL